MTPTPVTTVGSPRTTGVFARRSNSRTPAPSNTAARSMWISSASRRPALLDRMSAVHCHGLPAGSRSGSCNGAFDAVGDELDRRAGPWPAVGHVVGGDESGYIPRVLAAPAVGDLERAPTGEEGARPRPSSPSRGRRFGAETSERQCPISCSAWRPRRRPRSTSRRLRRPRRSRRRRTGRASIDMIATTLVIVGAPFATRARPILEAADARSDCPPGAVSESRPALRDDPRPGYRVAPPTRRARRRG